MEVWQRFQKQMPAASTLTLNLNHTPNLMNELRCCMLSLPQQCDPCCSWVASYPGLLALAFVACSTNAGEVLVKLSHVVWCTWTSDVKRSVILRSVFVISSTLANLLFFWECATPSYVQVHHTTWLSFTRPFPVLVLQVTTLGREGLGTRLVRTFD